MKDINNNLSIANTVYTSTNVYTHGGCTINLQGEIPHTGYAVGVRGKEKTFNSWFEFNNLDVLQYIRDHHSYLSKEGAYLDSWYDKETGKIHLDISIVYPTKFEAKTEAKKNSQIAIFDLYGGVEIRL